MLYSIFPAFPFTLPTLHHFIFISEPTYLYPFLLITISPLSPTFPLAFSTFPTFPITNSPHFFSFHAYPYTLPPHPLLLFILTPFPYLPITLLHLSHIPLHPANTSSFHTHPCTLHHILYPCTLQSQSFLLIIISTPSPYFPFTLSHLSHIP